MTDRFYPLGLSQDKELWKTTYEVQAEMRSFERSPFPPGCAVHLPGAREKFGYATPGPIAHRLAKPELCLREETDIENPRAHHAIPRQQVPDDREVFEHFDMDEMQRSYKSPVASKSMAMSASMMSGGRSCSLPALTGMGKSVSRLRQPHEATNKIDDHQFSYFVPKQLQREGTSKLGATNLSKLQKQNRITMPYGDGTGFRSQAGNCEWWAGGSYSSQEPTEARMAYQRPPFYRMSPLSQ